MQEEQVNERRKKLRQLKEGVSIEEFLRPISRRVFKGIPFDSKYPTQRKFKNFVQSTHTQWVDQELSKLLEYGSIKTWKSCSMGGSPVILAPLQVEEEKTKNRLIYNANF